MSKYSQDSQGIIVDIQRFSIHDGPGIRTTIFLKGCPLYCIWCHNPEAISRKPQLSFNSEKCKNCFECIRVCPSSAHYQINGVHNVYYHKCNLAKYCVDSCPNNALKIIGRYIKTSEIINIILRDVDYYKNSGGGITISGGEPMLQYEFTKSILIEAKKNSIHTALDTSGYASTNKYIKIKEYVDLFLFDYKETDAIKHKQYTGVDNNLILKNLDTLYKLGAKIILRCPIIPSINDTYSHFEGICKLHKKYPNIISIHIMPYHNMGFDKAKQAGIENKFIKLDTVGKDLALSWVSQLKKMGCEKVCLG